MEEKCPTLSKRSKLCSLLTCSLPSLPHQLYGGLGKQHAQSQWKLQPSSHRRRQNGAGVLSKPHSQKTGIIFPMYWIPGRPHLQVRLYLTWAGAHPEQQPFPPRACTENRQPRSLPEVVENSANNRLTKRLKRRNWRMRWPPRCPWKPRRPCHVQCCAHAQERLEKAGSSPLADLEILWKQEVKANAEF